MRFGKSEIITEADVARIVALCNQLEVGFEVTAEQLAIGQFDAGFMSQIYHVRFLSTDRPATVPPSVVIKCYAARPGFDNLDSQLTSLHAGQAGIGPKVLLIRTDALVMEFIEARPWTVNEDRDVRLRDQLAKTLAHFHSLRVPLQRNAYRERTQSLLSFGFFTEELEAELYEGQLKTALEQLGLTNLLAGNLRAELDFVRERILASQTEIVFAHRDLTHSNILVAKDTDRVLLVDFDLSLWFYRGADLGRYLIDCQQTDQFNDAELISDEEMRHFIEAYRGERARLAGSHFELDPANSTEHLLREAKILSFLAYMIDIIFCVRMASSQPDKRSQFLIKGDRRFGGLLKTKARFLADGTLTL